MSVPEPPQRFRVPELPARAGTLLSIDGVSVSHRLPGPISLVLPQRGRLLITGGNGAGKTTLLRVLSGALPPDTGTRRVSGNTRIAHLRQESTLPAGRRASKLFAEHVATLVSSGTLSGSDALTLGQLGLLRPRETTLRVGELSAGQQRRLDLAIALASRPHVLLLDEPSNHLSVTLVDELTEALAATQAAVVLSSHDRQLLRDVADWPRLLLGPGSGGGEPG